MMAELLDTTVDQWNERWKAGKCPWHEGQVNNMLEKHINDLTEGKPNLRVFVPMCGKSVDLLWLANAGHAVFGADCSRDAIVSFFQENNLEYTTDAINLGSDGGFVHKAKEKDITIFECDIFYLSGDVVGEKFDGIWGRATFSALGTDSSRRKYVDVISSLLAPTGKWMVDTFDFDRNDNPNGPNRGPHPFTLEQANKLFSDKFNLQLLDQVDFAEGEARFMPFSKIKHITRLFLLTFPRN